MNTCTVTVKQVFKEEIGGIFSFQNMSQFPVHPLTMQLVASFHSPHCSWIILTITITLLHMDNGNIVYSPQINLHAPAPNRNT